MGISQRVLVGSPTYEGMRYCNGNFIKSLKEIEYENYDILLVDNSRKDDFFKELSNIEGIKVLKDETKAEKNMDRLVSSRNKILDYAKENSYDFVLMMDADVIAPSNILKDLMVLDKDVVSGIYYNFFNSGEGIKKLPVVWKLLTEKEFEILKTKGIPSHLKREHCPRHLTNEEIESGENLEVFHPSAGCMLLSRKVVKDIRYGVEYRGERKSSDDVYFINRAREAGFTFWCNSKIICDHLSLEKLEKDIDGNLVHPAYK